MNKDTPPLGLPTGSVRSIIALLVIGTVCGLAACGKSTPDWLLTFAGTAFGFYFGARGQQSGKSPAAEILAALSTPAPVKQPDALIPDNVPALP